VFCCCRGDVVCRRTALGSVVTAPPLGLTPEKPQLLRLILFLTIGWCVSRHDAYICSVSIVFGLVVVC
jgi:hypothetical protein